MTDNPLGALAYHVQIDVLRGHLANVAYNDVLGHETDGLRTLVVGVKQGLGTIAINTVPAGGVEAHELRNYEDETYDLWLAEYPAETGTFDAPSNPVSITALPADGDGHLDYWMGSYFAYGPRDAAELSVILFEDTKLNAVIEGRPGMGTLDLVSDFEDFIAEVLPAVDWATLDENGISYDGDLNPVFTGNGMPDVAELGLLNAVLKDTEIDFAARSGVVNQFTWEAWAANLALAESQLGTAIPALSSKPYLARIVAAYMTLGEYDSVEWINVVMDTYTSQDVLDREAYDRSKQRYFKFEGDADNDGAWNIEEWQGLTLTGVLLDDIAAFFVARPGIASLDLVSDLGAWLVALGVYTAPEEVDAYDYDQGASDLVDLETVYLPNGIPDAAELRSLQMVLQHPAIEEKDGGVSHALVWRIYQTCLVQAQARLSGQSAAVQRGLAAYMTLGTFPHVGRVLNAPNLTVTARVVTPGGSKTLVHFRTLPPARCAGLTAYWLPWKL